MLRVLSFLILAALALPLRAQSGGAKLSGTVVANTYIAPTKAYQIEIPVLTALGGIIHDTANVVTFQDMYGTHITVGAFRQDATQKWELSTRGVKDYLIFFFGAYVLPDFKQFCAGASVESAKYSQEFMEGTLFAYVLLPGGSVVQPYSPIAPNLSPPVAKRGNALFTHNGYSFVVSTELGERVTEGSHFAKTAEEEDQILKERLVRIIARMAFPKAVTPSPTPAP